MKLSMQRIGHGYLGRTLFENFNLEIGEGEIVGLLGPSGGGKTTILQIAAGIIDPGRGKVARHYRRHGVIFQEPRLLPWMTLLDNIAYGLAASGMPATARREIAGAAARDVGLAASDLEKFPAELSGGMRQRAGVARALAVSPDILFLDEPFSAVDVGLRRYLQDRLVAAAARQHFSALFVTHDITEALRVCDRLMVLSARQGMIVTEQVVPGKPGHRTDRDIFDMAERLATDPHFMELYSGDERHL